MSDLMKMSLQQIPLRLATSTTNQGFLCIAGMTGFSWLDSCSFVIWRGWLVLVDIQLAVESSQEMFVYSILSKHVFR